MTHVAEISKALKDVPNDIAVPVLADIYKRITDWLASGGKSNDPYIKQQVNYAKRIGIQYGVKEINHG